MTHPLGFAQLEVVEADRLHPDGRQASWVAAAFRLTGELDTDRLVAAHERLARRHEALRTAVCGDRQVVSGDGGFPVSASVADGLDVAGAYARLRESAPPLDEGPLARALLVSTAANEHLLAWSIHHAVVDGWSLGLLWDDLCAAYAGVDPEPVPGYGEFARWQRDWAAGPEPAMLAGPLVAMLREGGPYSPEAPRTTRPVLGARVLHLAPERFAAADNAARAAGGTVFMAVLAAWTEAVRAYRPDLAEIVCTPTAGRTDPAYARTVGMFVNPLPVPVRDLGTARLDEVRDRFLAVLDAQEVPAALLPDVPRRNVLVLHNTPGTTRELPGVRTEVARDPDGPPLAPVLEFYSRPGRTVAISLALSPRSAGVAGLLEHDRAQVADDEAERIAATFEDLLGR